MLTTCPECQREVSDLAEACPGCGCPLKTLNPLALDGERHRAHAKLVELTAKRLKKHYAIAAGLFVVSMLLTTVSCFKSTFGSGPSWPFALSACVMVASMLYLITVKTLIWWHHR